MSINFYGLSHTYGICLLQNSHFRVIDLKLYKHSKPSPATSKVTIYLVHLVHYLEALERNLIKQKINLSEL